MYFSAEDRGEMMSMVYNWPAEQVSSTCRDAVNWGTFYVYLISLTSAFM